MHQRSPWCPHRLADEASVSISPMVCPGRLEAVLGSLTELVKRGKDGTTVVSKVPRKTAAAARRRCRGFLELGG